MCQKNGKKGLREKQTLASAVFRESSGTFEHVIVLFKRRLLKFYLHYFKFR